ncbi:hypothetical protein Poli38472_003393 [Pythium oligandrum]|uniref:Tubulin-specific chaperone D n=1 Tax=Pythium oligandrum TaxID=41045 RepID=A0A8K1C6S2_PYTOL|nr:hypothetical protein Poli38472_003393 [Pythium oligandrum]|eukprot:TMW57468.1 hypothetical protein Poli38472_003393 [Pythium oligandrum]
MATLSERPEDTEMENEELEEACSQRKFFQERAQVQELLKDVCNAVTVDDEQFERSHKQITTILDRYLEQSHLLDPYLRELLDPILSEIKRIVATVASERAAERQTAGDDGVAVFPFQLRRDPKLHRLCQLIYHLCKVRGYKTIVKLLPHEVSDFEPTLMMLQSQDRSDHSTWETRYVLLLWLSMLCLVPFDLNTIDSSTSTTTDTNLSIVSSILTLCKGYLADPGATQLAAAVCLARLLSRPDMEAHYLERFLAWANQELASVTASTGAPQSHLDGRVQQFRITGIMLSLAYLAKHSPREKHIDATRIYFASVMQLIEKLTDDDSHGEYRPIHSSTLHRKLSVKLVQRLGLLYLPPRVQAWRYKRGLRSLELNMQAIGLASATKGPSTLGGGQDTTGQDDDIMFDAVEELEQIVEVLLCGLRDKDTVVRWSAAKGIGRITGRLPYEYADDVVQSVLELFVSTESEGAWHGASLALAELARRGVLLPQRLTEAVDCVARALQYDIRRGAHSIGSHVRDAACYACWSFARAYEPLLLLPHLEKTLAPAMLINCVFDRELNCRRAASAAFQENVGRQGRTNFPHGIDLLTKADYFSVANLRHAFLDVSVFIAKYPEYRYSLVEHLVMQKITHWDASIRSLAAQALGKICALDAAHAMHFVLPRLLETALVAESEVIARHGAVLAICEVTLALLDLPSLIDGELQSKIKNLAIEMEKRRLFRGRGGEMIRVAVCQVVQVVAIGGFSLSFAHVKKYVSVLEECIIHPVESVRDAAIDAFAAFTAQYCPKMFERGPPPVRQFLTELVPRYLNNGVLVTMKERGVSSIVLNPNVAVRRGFLRAIGVASKELIQPTLSESLRVMMRAAVMKHQTAEEQDAESRVAAIRGLADLCSRVQCDGLVFGDVAEEEIVRTLIECVQDDYGMDERGDVGSWVRKEAMLGLERLYLNEPFAGCASELLLVGLRVRSRYGDGTIVKVTGRCRRRQSDAGDTTSETDKGALALNPICHVQFTKPALGFYYFAPLGIGQIHWSELHANEKELSRRRNGGDGTDEPFLIPAHSERLLTPARAEPPSLPFIRRVPVTITSEVVCALTKQLAEKLDNIRLLAGSILFRLLHSTNPRVDGIPDRFQLEKTIFPPTLAINWSMAHDTFPLVVRMMDIPEYMEAVASGLVVSVGGLTESVVKASKAALFEWFRTHLNAKDFGLLSRFSFFLVTLIRRHQQDDRVTIPLLKTLAMLLDDGLFAFLFEKKSSDEENEAAASFGDRLYDALKDEMQKATAMPKLAAGISVLVGLLPSDTETEGKALRALLMFIAHRFPKVRKLTAEKLYTRLLVHDDVVPEDKYDAITDILSCTAWDGAVTEVRAARNEVLEHLGMDVPQKKARVDKIDEAASTATETRSASSSYQALVKEMGY